MRNLLRKYLGVDQLVKEEMDRHLERIRQVSAAILGEEYVPPLIDCENKKHPVHLWDKWTHMPENSIKWTQPGSNGKDIVTRRRDLYVRKCRACGDVETKIIDNKLLNRGE